VLGASPNLLKPWQALGPGRWQILATTKWQQHLGQHHEKLEVQQNLKSHKQKNKKCSAATISRNNSKIMGWISTENRFCGRVKTNRSNMGDSGNIIFATWGYPAW